MKHLKQFGAKVQTLAHKARKYFDLKKLSLMAGGIMPMAGGGVAAPDNGGAAWATDNIVNAINTVLTASQAIGGALAAVMIVWAGIQLATGGREGLQHAKVKLVCIAVGIFLLVSASALKGWVWNLFTT